MTSSLLELYSSDVDGKVLRRVILLFKGTSPIVAIIIIILYYYIMKKFPRFHVRHTELGILTPVVWKDNTICSVTLPYEGYYRISFTQNFLFSSISRLFLPL